MSVITSKMIIISARRLHRPLQPYIFWKLMMKAIQKSSENTNTKTKTMTKTTTKTKTHTKCLKTQHMLYFWNPDDLRIPNMMIDTSPWPSCSRQSPRLPCSGHTISSTGPSVSPFRDFFESVPNCLNYFLSNVLQREGWEQVECRHPIKCKSPIFGFSCGLEQLISHP